MYSKDFAKIYDTEWADFSETLADIIISNVKLNYGSLLDLGCGTGNFIKKLENKFSRLVGIDLSKDMIDIAKKKCKKADFFVKSVTDFDFNEKFDLITCNFDMINHLSDIKDWEKMFKLAHNHLKESGVFIFDFNTIYKMNNFDYEQHEREDEKYRYVAKDTKLDENHVNMFIQIFDKSNKRIAYVDETESFYSEEVVNEALKNAGFVNIKFANKELEEVSDFNCNRLFVICKK